MSKSLALAFAFAACTALTSAAHADCQRPRTAAEDTTCAKAAYTEAWKKMNYVLKNNIYSVGLFDAKLGKATQTLFLAYVESHCAFERAMFRKAGGEQNQAAAFVMKCQAKMYNGRVSMLSGMLGGA